MTVVHDDMLFAELARLRTTLPADSTFITALEAVLDARYPLTPPAWTAYTPVLTATVSNPNLGATGVAKGRWSQQGKDVRGWMVLSFGGAGAAAGSGSYQLSLPVTPRSDTVTIPVGHGFIFDLSGADVRTAAELVLNASATTAQIRPNAISGNVTNSSPWTWAAADLLEFAFQFEAA